MTFTDIISLWGVQDLAKDLGLPAKNVRRWLDIGSIPAEWFMAVEAAAETRGFDEVTVEALSKAAHERRLAKQSPEAANDAGLRENAA